jgi:2-hydroxycyclohexanecarboxyl-CoA dehydrogenase
MSRVAVVTGGASGIGLGVAQGFVADGHRVALVDSNAEAAETAAEELRRGGATAIAVAADVADRAAVAAGFDRIRSELGPVEILVTSAGIESFTPVLDITAEGWDRIIAINLTGTFTCVQAALPDMLAAGWGRIVTISSQSAQSGAPNMAHYAASKGGVIGLTKALAVELARQRDHREHHPAQPGRYADGPEGGSGGRLSRRRHRRAHGPTRPSRYARADIAAACSFLCSEEQ